jgi:predicted ATP-dependent endonuclease of OLD family
MILDKVRIEDFKSIKALTVDLHELTCFVGKNESGKSAILEAISYLNYDKNKLDINLTNKNSSKYNSEGFATIKGYYLLNEEDNLELSELLPLQFDSNNKAIPKKKLNFKWIRLIVNGNQESDIIIELLHANNHVSPILNNYTPQEKLKIKKDITNKMLPVIELFTNDSLTLAPITVEQFQQNEVIVQSFKRLLEIAGINDLSKLKQKPERYHHKLKDGGKIISKLLNKVYKQDEKLKVGFDLFNSKLMVSFEDDSEKTYSLTERSLGFQYFFAFLINKTYLNKFDAKKYVFLLDEPGNSLHPEGAKNLVSIFEDIAETDQVLYSTHNPFLAFRKKPDNLILVRKTGTKGTELLTKVYTNKYQILRKELGLMLNDSFLVNDINLVVEGNADKWILHYIIHEDDDFEPLTWTHIFSADTASEIIPSVRYLSNLELKGVVLLDSDDAGNKEIKKPKFKKYILDSKNWSHLTLDEVFKDAKKRTIEDMLLHQKYVEAYNKYYKEEDAVEWNVAFKPLVITKYNLPILDQINKHFKQYADGGINKIAVLRKFTELNPYDTNIGFYKDLKALLLIIQERVMKLNA